MGRMIDTAAILRLAREGKPSRHIAEATGHQWQTVVDTLDRHGVPRPRGKRGATRVDPAKLAGAAADLIAGMYRRDVKAKYGIGSIVVNRIATQNRDAIAAAAIDRKLSKVARQFSANTPRWCEPYRGNRCAYHDCRWPLPGQGICQKGIGNPACVARGPRLTAAVLGGVPPTGWIVERDYYPRADPEVHHLVRRAADLVLAGVGAPEIGRKLGISAERAAVICGAGVRLELRRRALP